MFSIPTSFPTLSALGRIFSLNSWLAHLKSWHHSDRRSNSGGGFEQDSLIAPCTPMFIPASISFLDPLSLNLPSPTMHFTFDSDPEVSFETDSEPSSIASSRCSTPSLKEEPNQRSASIYPKTGAAHTAPNNIMSPLVGVPHLNRESLLAQYSHQELVLLEFLTHLSHVDVRDIDEIMCMYPPGFINACHCAMEGELCRSCQLADTYIEYSFQRCREAVTM